MLRTASHSACTVPAIVGWLMLFALAVAASGQEYVPPDESDAGRSQTDVRMQEVVEGLQAWKRSFDSIWMVTNGFDRTTMAKTWPDFPPNAVLDGKSWGQRTEFWYHDPFTLGFQHDWLVAGNSEYRVKGAAKDFRYWLAASQQGQPNVFSSRRSEPLQYLASPTVHQLQEHPLQNQCRMAALRGLWWSSGCEWVGDKLSDVYSLHYVGTQMVDGHRCVVLSNGRGPHQETADGVRLTWYFDPAIQYLPRKFRLSEMSLTGEQEDIDQVWQATEFQKTEQGVWFPLRGFISRHYGAHKVDDPPDSLFEWVVLELRLNEKQPLNLMQAPPARQDNEAENGDQTEKQNLSAGTDDLQLLAGGSGESARKFADRLRADQKRQLQRDSLFLLLVIMITGTAVLTVYLGYQRLAGNNGKSSA